MNTTPNNDSFLSIKEIRIKKLDIEKLVLQDDPALSTVRIGFNRGLDMASAEKRLQLQSAERPIPVVIDPGPFSESSTYRSYEEFILRSIELETVVALAKNFKIDVDRYMTAQIVPVLTPKHKQSVWSDAEVIAAYKYEALAVIKADGQIVSVPVIWLKPNI